jgi:hypothetical protein
MASLYSSKASDSGMTLDLSLEINQKLQERIFFFKLFFAAKMHIYIVFERKLGA